MKLLELTIRNIRGIPDLTLKPDGKNMVICGPNGSGKSSVIDAIDFLFTGQISRFLGRGTGGITLQAHGVHLDSLKNLENAYVSGRIKLDKTRIAEIRRLVSRSSILICEESDREEIELLLRLASNGQHVLTRQKILQYVTEQPKDRAEKILALLGLSNLEDIRVSLVRVKNNLDKDYTKALGSYQTIKGQIGSLIEAIEWTDSGVLAFINQQRAMLGENPIDALDPNLVRHNLAFSLRSETSTFANPTIFEADTNNLRRIRTTEIQSKLTLADQTLRSTLGMIQADPRLMHELAHQQLIDQGIKLLDETGVCPLCQTAFPVGELRRKLETRFAAAEEATRLKDRVEKASREIAEIVEFIIPSLNKVITAAEQVHDTVVSLTLQSWQKRLTLFRRNLQHPFEQYLGLDDQVGTLFSPPDIEVILTQLTSAVSTAFPESSPEQTAYDRLTQIESFLTSWSQEKIKHEAAKRGKEYSETLYQTFLVARDKILGELYSEIRQRFEELYRLLHGPDEANFISLLEPDEAGLDFRVDFHGRGMHPPHALHSEGHQDSMGICLFLALAERLTKGKFNLTLLDDVVMSVDAEHRKDMCRLLREQFPDRQFIIATHDEVWARYLQSMKVVERKEKIDLFSWNLSDGPSSDYQQDIWTQIEKDLQANDIPSATGKLRRWAEAFFRDACDNLAAPVIFQSSGAYTLGDFLPAANGKWIKYLKEAKKAANSYGDTDLVRTLENNEEKPFESVRKKIEQEDWIVNATVHFNSGITPSIDEVRSIVDAFKQLSSFYLCSQCNEMIRVDRRLSPAHVGCTCGKKVWHLANKQAPK